MLPSTGTLIMVCGLPGSGKTTLAKRLEAERNAIRMCPDDWIEAILESPEDLQERDRLRDPIENLQWELAQEYLQKGLTVILEYGFWAEEERIAFSMRGVELGARIEIHYLHAPRFEQLWQRVESRNQTFTTGTWVMTREEMSRNWNLFQVPTDEELNFYDEGTVVPWNDER